MAVVGIRQLSRDTSRIIKQFEETGEPVILTREGRPIGALMQVDQAQLEDIVLATAPALRESHERAKEEAAEGLTRSIEEVAAERGIDLDEAAEIAEGEIAERPGAEPISFGYPEPFAPEDVRAVTEAELLPLAGLLSDAVAGRIVSEASVVVGALSGEALAAIGDYEPEATEHVQEVGSLTASLYATLLRRNLMRQIGHGDTEEAIDHSQRLAGEKLRLLNRELLGAGSPSFERYLATLNGVRLAWGAGDEEEAPAAVFGEPLSR